MYDLLIRGGTVVDPKNKRNGALDIGIENGKVAEIGPDVSASKAREMIDLTGYTLIPGVIDTHVHARGAAHRLMAKAGVCTCLDMSAIHSIIREIPERGCGLNVMGLQGIQPFPDSMPTRDTVQKLIREALEGGAIGIKLMGGHVPSSPDATRMKIAIANEMGAYVAFHVGTTENGSNLHGLLEAIDLAGDNRLHIAHVNSYLRGMIKHPVEEVLDGLGALKGKTNLVSESYLAIINGTGGRITDGLPHSHVTRNCLRMRGYEISREGLEAAIRDGYCLVQVEVAGETELMTAHEGVEYWKEHDTNVSVSFPVNVPEATFLCATAKDADGEFIVDAISTDGGSIPRNVAVESGLALVRYGALTLEQFVHKVSTAGAAMLGLPAKGHLGESADADITVLDTRQAKPVMTIVGGKIVMAHGVIYGRRGTIICTKQGIEAPKSVGLDYQTIDVSDTLLYTK